MSSTTRTVAWRRLVPVWFGIVAGWFRASVSDTAPLVTPGLWLSGDSDFIFRTGHTSKPEGFQVVLGSDGNSKWVWAFRVALPVASLVPIVANLLICLDSTVIPHVLHAPPRDNQRLFKISSNLLKIPSEFRCYKSRKTTLAPIRLRAWLGCSSPGIFLRKLHAQSCLRVLREVSRKISERFGILNRIRIYEALIYVDERLR